MTRLRHRLLAIGATLLAACGALVVSASPASAHGIGGTQPTNYKSTVTRLAPPTPGVHMETIDLGNRLQLTNDSGRDVLVLGYDDEPYLRVGPRGVFENVRSPAVYLNRSITTITAPPKSADSSAPPKWQRISDGNVARWHDHRVHWMGTEAPPNVQRDPHRRHVIERWVVPLRAGDQKVEVHGVLAWEPPPSPWPAVALAVVLAGVVIGLSRTRHWRSVLVVSLAALVVSSTLHTVGYWGASTAGFGTTLLDSVYGIVGAGLGIVALVWAARRGVTAAVPLVLVASVFLLVATGLGDIATIGHALVPSSLPATITRLAVTCTIGIGAGLAVASALRLRPAVPSGRTRVRPAPAGARSTVTS